MSSDRPLDFSKPHPKEEEGGENKDYEDCVEERRR